MRHQASSTAVRRTYLAAATNRNHSSVCRRGYSKKILHHSGIANIHNVVALVDGNSSQEAGVPPDAEGASIEGDWDPLGMRGTDSRDLILTDAFVPDDHEVLPPGVFDAMVQRFPYFYMTLSFSYLGLMRAILDLTGEYLRGEHGVASRRDNHVKQAGWAEMQMIYDKAQSLMYRVLTEAAVDPLQPIDFSDFANLMDTMDSVAKSIGRTVK